MAIRGNAAFHVRPYLSVQPGQFYRIARRGFWGDGICKGKATLQQVVDLLHIAGRRNGCTLLLGPGQQHLIKPDALILKQFRGVGADRYLAVTTGIVSVTS